MAKKKAVKKKKAPKYNLRSKITSALRKIWSYSPQKRAALKRCELPETFVKTARSGRKYKTHYHFCEHCHEKTDSIQIDHKITVVPYEGFDGDWNSYISRLMVEPEGLQGLCPACHSSRTLVQKQLRKQNKSTKIVKKVLTKKK